MATHDCPVTWTYIDNVTTGNDYTIWNNGGTGTLYIPPPDDLTWKTFSNLDELNKWKEQQDKPLKKERKVGMETLYQVIVVSKDREVLLDAMVVAEDQDEAKLGVDIHSVLREKKLKLKDVTILATELGDVKVRKEVQKVKVVDKDEE